jgi:hypothetical protein
MSVAPASSPPMVRLLQKLSRMNIPKTTERVQRQTSSAVNCAIAEETVKNVRSFAGHPEKIGARIAALDREWDIERTLEANAASVSLLGIILAATVDRRFLILPGIVATFLLQHALQGWCPPLPVFRRMGVRTQSEIEQERYALKALRGDFAGTSGNRGDPDAAMQAVHI